MSVSLINWEVLKLGILVWLLLALLAAGVAARTHIRAAHYDIKVSMDDPLAKKLDK